MSEKARAIRLVKVLRGELATLLQESRQVNALTSASTHAFLALQKWEERAISEIRYKISTLEAQSFEAIRTNHSLTNFSNPLGISALARKHDHFLEELSNDIDSNPESVLIANLADSESREQSMVTNSPKKDTVFIVHGHDEPNLYRLKEILKERYSLNTIILQSEAGGGRTIIEKFEEEARKAAFAFVLLTPDDIINTKNKEYRQARPNVTFELGWFYGRLGRANVCILSKNGAEIQTDLKGVSRIDFDNYVNEKVEEIERELITGGLISK